MNKPASEQTVSHIAHPAPHSQAIRRRLLWLLIKVFGAVVLITMVLLLGLIAMVSAGPRSGKALFPPSQVAILETYYLARGNWEDVNILWETTPGSNFRSDEWSRLVLVDENDRVIAGNRQDIQIGQTYSAVGDSVSFPIQVGGYLVGSLVYTSAFISPPFIVALGILPLVAISLITAVVTLFIGLLLMRRIIPPLADVIAAAQEVTAGKLSARVVVSGPDDFRALGDSFNQMVDTLQQNEQHRRNLLADIAHELRTPITILRGRLEGILDGIYPLEETHIAPALIQTRLLEKLVDDLRLLTLVETGQLRFERGPVHLGEVTEQMISLFEAEAMSKEVTLTLNAAPDLPLISADSGRISQVIGNLLSNALRHVPDRGHIEITVKQVAEDVSLSVGDSGAGVPEADLPYLFDRFWRGEKSRSRSSGGAGLGLAISKRLVEAQHGRIEAQNQSNGGLCVTVTFPTRS